VPSSRQYTLFPECVVRYNRDPDGVAAWRQAGAGHMDSGEGQSACCAGPVLRQLLVRSVAVGFRRKILLKIRVTFKTHFSHVHI